MESKKATEIETIIILSMKIIQLNSIIKVLNELKSHLNYTTIVLNYCLINQPLMLSEVGAQIFKLNQVIKPILLSLFKGIKFIGYEDETTSNWALGRYALSKRYLQLETRVSEKETKEYILFLTDYKDSSHNIKAGELIEMEKIYPILGNIPKNKNMIW